MLDQENQALHNFKQPPHGFIEVLKAVKSSTKMGAGYHVNCTYRIVMMYVQPLEKKKKKKKTN